MIRDGNGYRTAEALSWWIGPPETGMPYEVPEGSWFDVSIPKALHWLLDPDDPRFLRAAALHDHMLASDWAGAVFNEALREDGVGRTCRFLMWAAVSLWKWR
jgi:hypothetical protein